MIELWKSLSDDQMALTGKAAALMVTGTMMSLSYDIGRGRSAPAGQKTSEPLVVDSQAAQMLPTVFAIGRRPQRREAA